MELWSLILLSVFFSTSIHLFLFNIKKSKHPPGPPAIPILGSLVWLRRSITELQAISRDLRKQYGPIITFFVGSQPIIVINDRAITHKALVEHGAVFSDRPAPPPSAKFIGSDQHCVSASAYGPIWRLLRRNLMSEILQPPRIKIFAESREWVLEVLINDLHAQRTSSDDGAVTAKTSFDFAVFGLLALMCFGEKLDEKAIREIEVTGKNLISYLKNLKVLAILPSISKYIFFNRWKTVMELKERHKAVIRPLIEARRQHKRSRVSNTKERFVHSYLDSILDIKFPQEGGRNVTEDEIVTLCSEFLNGGTDTTSNGLQWMMAELVRRPEIQKKLAEEIESVAEEGEGRVREEELQKMPYLKAVVMEGLRRHPPARFLLPHAVTGDIEFEGYLIPKSAVIQFMVADMGWDENAWTEPMEFRPERFLAGGEGEGVDITGSREIKMLPFGVGRRICPGLGLGMLHLEYFVANLVREFEWKAVDGEEVDMSDKLEFITEMKHPLRARLIPRRIR